MHVYVPLCACVRDSVCACECVLVRLCMCAFVCVRCGELIQESCKSDVSHQNKDLEEL